MGLKKLGFSEDDYVLQDDGDGVVYIAEWKSESAQPTKTQIETAHAQWQTEYALAGMRTKRDRLLTESDWTQSRDVTLSDDNDWKTYRQALRDLPSGKTTKAHVDAATWPTKP